MRRELVTLRFPRAGLGSSRLRVLRAHAAGDKRSSAACYRQQKKFATAEKHDAIVEAADVPQISGRRTK
jgi:hypothetical protein